MQKGILKSFLLLFFFQISYAQKPQKPNATEIYNQIQKLNFLGTVLYVAAHPDDENTRLISYLANEVHARTGYLSLTRGDGGQNLIGPQLRELLGVIRTQELLEARKIDGGEQFFTRANDFGFSKNPDETLQIWDKDKVLADLVWTIRKFRPDVIINRFDHRSPGTTHGHHTASALLSLEGFDLVNSPKAYPEQLPYVEPWQPQRLFFNTSWWFYGSKEKFDAADKSSLIDFATGVYYPTIGKSNQEIAALSRSCHKSQGFGSTGTRGEEKEYLEFIKGTPLQNKSSLFEGIDTSWNRVKGGKSIGELISKITSQFDFKNPSASVPDLVKAYGMIQSLPDTHWKTIKTEEIKKIIAGCTGLFIEAVSSIQETTPGSTITLKLEAINRSAIEMQLVNVITVPEQKTTVFNTNLNHNILENKTIELQIPQNSNFTQPYWLKNKGTEGLYTVDDQNIIGTPDIIRENKVIFTIKILGVEIPFDKTIVYKYTDDVKGEMYTYLDIVPIVTTTISDKVLLFTNTNSKYVAVNIKAGKDKINGTLQLELPKEWKVSPAFIPFQIDKKGIEQTVFFEVTPPKNNTEAIGKSIAIVDGIPFDKEQININFDHIAKQQVLKTAEVKCLRLDLKNNQERVAYIMGAGDEVPNSLSQMGYKVTIVKPEELTPEKLENFDVVMTGIRAYNTVLSLSNKQQLLFEFVKKGKTMIVQYNTTDDLVTNTLAPYPLKISRDRVTEENAEVRFLAPNHPALNYPNKIAATDFKGWKQEQGLYYPNEYDKAFTAILSSNDKNETPKEGALLIAPYGKGNYIYTGLSFFRELPEGVPGAYKLLSNMISMKPTVTLPNTNIKN